MPQALPCTPARILYEKKLQNRLRRSEIRLAQFLKHGGQ
jgi:hypothetical protein